MSKSKATIIELIQIKDNNKPDECGLIVPHLVLNQVVWVQILSLDMKNIS